MRYYQYISDSKVDMLLPQIPLTAKQKITSEIGFDIKVLSAKLKTERESLDNRVSRVTVVEKYLRDSQRIGSLLDPAPWISDTQEVSTALFVDLNMVAIFGVTNGTHFLLSGSAENIIGAKPSSSVGYSNLAMVNNFITTAIEADENALEGKPARSTQLFTGRVFTRSVLQFLHDQSQRELGPQMRVEFMARRLHIDSSTEGIKVFVGTPVYVAQTDDDWVH